MLIDIRVPSHGHRLVAVDLNTGYICDGCEEKGTGWRYRCSACDYDMHTFCAKAAPSISHPLRAGHMQLLSSPLQRDSLWCSACEKSVKGLRYYCSLSRDALHPSCARLPKAPQFASNIFHLSQNLSSPCNECGQRNRGWAYVSTNYNIHVHCLVEVFEATYNMHVHSLIEALETPASQDFNASNVYQRQLSNARILMTEGHATSDHQHSTAAPATSRTLQRQPKHKPKHTAIRVICKSTKLLLKAIYAIFFGDPSSLATEIVTLFYNN